MTFPEPGSGPTLEFDDLWSDVPLPEGLEAELGRLGDRATELLNMLAPSDIVFCW